MMKKSVLYFLAFVGFLCLLYFIYHLLFSITGPTMYGGGISPNRASIGSAVSDGSVTSVPGGSSGLALYSKLQQVSTNSTTQTPPSSENAMRRMIIRNANIAIQVKDVNQTIDAITRLADKSGGYVVRSNASQNNGAIYGEISIRVPAEGLNNILKQVKSLAIQVTQEAVSGEDITQQYIDLQSQLDNLQKSKKQLEKIMLSAVNTEDVLKVHQQLSETQGQIDVLEGQIKYYKESVALSLITITMEKSPTIESEYQAQWQIAEVFKSSYINLVDGLRHFVYGLIQFFVYFLPFILLWGCIAFLLYWIGKKVYLFFMNR